MVFLESSDDMNWLAEVHSHVARHYKCAILHGNEDYPTRVELYIENSVLYKPTILEPDKDGKLLVVKWGDRVAKPKKRGRSP